MAWLLLLLVLSVAPPQGIAQSPAAQREHMLDLYSFYPDYGTVDGAEWTLDANPIDPEHLPDWAVLIEIVVERGEVTKMKWRSK